MYSSSIRPCSEAFASSKLPIYVPKYPRSFDQSLSSVACSSTSTQTAAAELDANINHHSTNASALCIYETASAKLSILEMRLSITILSMSQQPLSKACLSMRMSQVYVRVAFTYVQRFMLQIQRWPLYMSLGRTRFVNASGPLCLLLIFSIDSPTF